MLEHWISPLDTSLFDALSSTRNSLGKQVQFEYGSQTQKRAAAIIGADTKWANRVRRHLYRFSADFQSLALTDLGNFRSSQPDFMCEAIKELIDSGVIPIILGAPRSFDLPLIKSLAKRKDYSNSLIVAESLPAWLEFESESPKTQFLGMQQHVTMPVLQSMAIDRHFPILRLGASRDGLEEVEPYARESNALLFDLSSMRMADLLAQKARSSSGYCTEEACRIMRYSGLSPLLQCVAVTGHDPMCLSHDVSANTTAQLCWYLLSGLNSRVDEKPATTDNFTQYTIQLSECEFDLTFFKSKRSGRWWVQIPGKDNVETHPCAHADYVSACEDRVTGRILSFIDASL